MPEGANTLTDEELRKFQVEVLKTRRAFTSILLLSFGGIIAFSILILQDAITLGPVDLATIISTVACAAAIPLLVATTWVIRAWGSPQEGDEPDSTRLYSDVEYRFKESISGWLTKASTPMALVGLSSAFIGIFAALWHVFWVASVILTLSVFWGIWGFYRGWVRMWPWIEPPKIQGKL